MSSSAAPVNDASLVAAPDAAAVGGDAAAGRRRNESSDSEDDNDDTIVEDVGGHAAAGRRRNELSDSEDDDDEVIGVHSPDYSRTIRTGSDDLVELFWSFRLQRNGNEDRVLDTIMKILRAEGPALASHRFAHQPYSASATIPVNPHTTSHSGITLLPFTYLLIGGASLEVLKELLDMAPPSDKLKYTEKMPDGRFYSTLQTACLHRSHEAELIRYIATVDRIEVRRLYCTGSALPIQLALDKFAPLETIEVLLDQFPYDLRVKDPISRMDCLERALWHQSPADPAIVDLIVDRIKRSYNTRDLKFSHENFLITQEIAKRLLEILIGVPKIRRFECHPGNWEAGGWIHLLHNMPIHSHLVEVSLKFPQNLRADESVPAAEALSTFVSKTTNIRSLKLVADDDVSRLLQGLIQGLRINASLNSLCLVDVRFSNDADFGGLLAASSTIRKFKVCGAWFSNKLHLPPLDQVRSCALEEFSFSSIRIPTQCMGQILSILQEMPHLKSIDFDSRFEDGFWKPLTHQLANLIRLSKIKSLRLNKGRGFSRGVQEGWDISPIIEALKGNSSLVSLDITPYRPRPDDMQVLLEMLQESNTTLKKFGFWRYCKNWPLQFQSQASIRHTLDLNRYGRGEVRSADITLNRFVDLLSVVCDKDAFIDRLGYSFLRECPGLWSVMPQSNRKRTRDQI